jgi:hypothetical protein
MGGGNGQMDCQTCEETGLGSDKRAYGLAKYMHEVRRAPRGTPRLAM